jgi:hypothetical protein
MRQSSRPVENFFANRAARREAIRRVVVPAIRAVGSVTRDRHAVQQALRKCLCRRHFFHASKIAIMTHAGSGRARRPRADQRSSAPIVRHGAPSSSTIR